MVSDGGVQREPELIRGSPLRHLDDVKCRQAVLSTPAARRKRGISMEPSKALAAAFISAALLCLSSAVLADEPTEGHHLCRDLGVDVWGLSYHLNHHDFHYNDTNLGGGLRCYERPDWRVLGRRKDTQLFVQADALVDSHRGILFPVSVGVETRVANVSNTFTLFAEGALTLAYYGRAASDGASQLRWGPVPALVLGCGRAKINGMFVPSPSREVLAAVAASLTISLKGHAS
jgi:hypothetical protein